MRKDTGPSTRIYYLAKSLTNFGNEIHIIIPGQSGLLEWFNDLWVHRIEGFFSSRILKLLSVFLGVLRPTSLYFYDISFILRALRVMLKCHLVQIEQPWAGGLLIPFLIKFSRKPFVVDSHDVFQSFKTKRTWLRKMLEIFIERIAYRYADIILTVSEKEKEVLIEYGVSKNKIAVIPNGVDTEVFVPSHDKNSILKDFPEGFKILFVGNMEYWPNQEASKLIETQIAPRILEKIDKVIFFMVGRVPPGLGHVSSSSNLIFTGPVDDVRNYLSNSDVAIAPLLHGSGTRLKILEYFSCALPVVSTTIGVEGLDVENGVNVIVEDDMDKFAEKVIELLRDKMLCERLGKAARELVVSKYDWQEIGKRLNNIYCKILS